MQRARVVTDQVNVTHTASPIKAVKNRLRLSESVHSNHLYDLADDSLRCMDVDMVQIDDLIGIIDETLTVIEKRAGF